MSNSKNDNSQMRQQVFQRMQQKQNNLDKEESKDGVPLGCIESIFDTLKLMQLKGSKKPQHFGWEKQGLSKEQIYESNKTFQNQDFSAQELGFRIEGQLMNGWLHVLKQKSQKPISNTQLDSSFYNAQEFQLPDQRVMQKKKKFYIFSKGKMFQFESEAANQSKKYLNIKNCVIDMIDLPRLSQTTIVHQGVQMNIDQAIAIKSYNQVFFVVSGTKGDSNSKRKDLKQWFERMKRYCILQNLKGQYEIGNLLGKGNFAKVYEATKYSTREKFALKTIDKATLVQSERNFMSLLQEVQLLRKLSHENIILLHEVFESQNNIHLVLEYLHGGELFERIKKNGTYNETEASVIMRCILRALVAMHSKNIVHRDLKPENLLFQNENIDSLKIVDFGLSASTKNGLLDMRCGSPGYVAPEILNDEGYGTQVDIFSAGIILYILLTGKFVFSGKNIKEILYKNRDCMVPFPPQYWGQLSPESRDLVGKMLKKAPGQRITALEALKHPWFQSQGTHLRRLDFGFDEFEDIPSMDDEPQVITNQNLLLITSSPIWNKSKMREILQITNLDEEKKSHFQTPLPGPRILANKREISNFQQKLEKGGMMMRILKPTSGLADNQDQEEDKYDNSNECPIINHLVSQKCLTPALKKRDQPLRPQASKQADRARLQLLGPKAVVQEQNSRVEQQPSYSIEEQKKQKMEEKKDFKIKPWIKGVHLLPEVIEDIQMEEMKSVRGPDSGEGFSQSKRTPVNDGSMHVKMESKNNFDQIQKIRLTEDIESIGEEEIEEGYGLMTYSKEINEFVVHSNSLALQQSKSLIPIRSSSEKNNSTQNQMNVSSGGSLNSFNVLSFKMQELQNPYYRKSQFSNTNSNNILNKFACKDSIKNFDSKENCEKVDNSPLNERAESKSLLAGIEEEIDEGKFSIPNTPGGLGVSRNILRDKDKPDVGSITIKLGLGDNFQMNKLLRPSAEAKNVPKQLKKLLFEEVKQELVEGAQVSTKIRQLSKKQSMEEEEFEPKQDPVTIQVQQLSSSEKSPDFERNASSPQLQERFSLSPDKISKHNPQGSADFFTCKGSQMHMEAFENS